jgi:hypothetical protein
MLTAAAAVAALWVVLAPRPGAGPGPRADLHPAPDTGDAVCHQKGTASALDQSVIARSRDVGAAAVSSPVVNHKALTFRVRTGQFVDDQGGSSWNMLGSATRGALASRRLGGLCTGTTCGSHVRPGSRRPASVRHRVGVVAIFGPALTRFPR